MPIAQMWTFDRECFTRDAQSYGTAREGTGGVWKVGNRVIERKNSWFYWSLRSKTQLILTPLKARQIVTCWTKLEAAAFIVFCSWRHTEPSGRWIWAHCLFHLPLNNLPAPITPFCQPLATIDLLSISTDLPGLDFP